VNKIGSLEKTISEIEADAVRIRSSIERMEADAEFAAKGLRHDA
jgi:hypothetical protein